MVSSFILVVASGCDCGAGGDDDAPGPADAAADGGADADAATDAGRDAATDAGLDAGDAAVDDAGTDAATGDAGPIADAGVADDAGAPDAGPSDDAGPRVLTCTSCHGEGDQPAPPLDTQGRRETTLPTVGAHRRHVHAGHLFRTGQCTDCHLVPETNDAPGHIDDAPAELTWGALPMTDGVAPRYDGTLCSVYCHGETLSGGILTQPDWTGDEQSFCGSCHGAPPPAPHPVIVGFSCGGCHPFQGLLPIDPERHVDGILDVTVDCSTCHGGEEGPAPPVDTHGSADTSSRGVGAHASHLGDSDWRAPISCTDCHVVPVEAGDVGHIDGDGVAELTWGTLATDDGAAPAWDGVACTGTYCHGETLSGGTETTPTWTQVDGTQDACGTCHGLPPTENHPESDRCDACHAPVIDAARDIVRPDLHIDGTVQVDPNASCGACHELPPATGTHALHAARAEAVYGGLGTAASLGITDTYAFGCGQCHPLDEAHHMNGGRAEVVLTDPAAPADSLKALAAPTASYVPGALVQTDSFGLEYTLGTCADVYCHSGMSTESGDVQEPGVDFPFIGYPIVYPAYTVTRVRERVSATWGGDLGCDGCHGYAPRGEAPSVTASAGESHAFLGADGYEDLHAWNHGWDPVPCRTCHYRTVHAAATFARDAAGVTVFDDVAIAGFDRHVDGTIDVAFDRVDPMNLYPDPMDLGPAAWDSGTRTCTNVACHLSQTAVAFGSPYRWANGPECNACHQY